MAHPPPASPAALVDVPVTGSLDPTTAVASLSYRALAEPRKRLRVLSELSTADGPTRDAFLLLVLQNPPPVVFDALHPPRWDNLFTYDERVFAWLDGGSQPIRHLDRRWPFGGPKPSAIARGVAALVEAEPRWSSLAATYLQAPRNLDSVAFTAVALPLAAAAPAAELRRSLARVFAAPALGRAGVLGTPAHRLGRALAVARRRRACGARLYAAGLAPLLARTLAGPRPDARALAAAVARAIVEGAPASDPAAFDRLAPLVTPAVAKADPELVAWMLRTYPGFVRGRGLAREPRWRDVLAALRADRSLRPTIDRVLAP